MKRRPTFQYDCVQLLSPGAAYTGSGPPSNNPFTFGAEYISLQQVNHILSPGKLKTRETVEYYRTLPLRMCSNMSISNSGSQSHPPM